MSQAMLVPTYPYTRGSIHKAGSTHCGTEIGRQVIFSCSISPISSDSPPLIFAL